MKLTVFFDGGFWVGILEEADPDGKVRAYRHIFGPEPTEPEVLLFVEQELTGCWDKSSAWTVDGWKRTPAAGRVNPKRLARTVAKELQRRGPSSYAQEALKQELEHRKKERKVQSREEREAEKERKRELAREKAKQKHRGH